MALFFIDRYLAHIVTLAEIIREYNLRYQSNLRLAVLPRLMHAMRVYNLDQPHLDIYRPIDSGCLIRTLENLTNITTALAQVPLYLSVIGDYYFPSLNVRYTSQAIDPWL
ncbi:hypothetical protein FRB91_004963 [Serendipita sp. 411]|nr:hypothetical protein FRB91_004963 [Serendipita sp. 411]